MLFLLKRLVLRVRASAPRSVCPYLVSMAPHCEPTGPGAGVGGGGGGRGCVWHHAAEGTRPAGLRYRRALHSLCAVPRRKGTSAEGRHLGAPGHPPPGPGAPGAGLCSCLPCNLQSFHEHRHPHRAALPEVRVSLRSFSISISHAGCSTRLRFVGAGTQTAQQDVKSHTHQTGSCSPLIHVYLIVLPASSLATARQTSQSHSLVSVGSLSLSFDSRCWPIYLKEI